MSCASSTTKHIRRHLFLILLALLMTALSARMANFEHLIAKMNKYYLFLACVTTIGSAVTGFWLLAPGVVAGMFTFLFLQSVFHLNVESAEFYFFTDNKLMYPGGPHFSMQKYPTVVGVLSVFFNMVGLVLYNCGMHKVRGVTCMNHVLRYVYESRVSSALRV